MIFWGGLLCVFDITFTTKTNAHGFRFDLLNDALGMILIAIGVCRLAAVRVSDRYRAAMIFVAVVSFPATVEAFFNHLIFPRPALLSFAASVFAMVCLAAIVVFCVAMRWFCREAGMDAAGDSWKLTTWLFVLIYALPLGLFYAAAGFAVLSGQSFNINLGPAGLLLLPVFAVPLIHLFVSTSRMRRGAEEWREGPVAEAVPLGDYVEPPRDLRG
jgi:hypothetical protein